MAYENVTGLLVKLHSDHGVTKCPRCDENLSGGNFEGAFRHLRQHHGLAVLHVGSETDVCADGSTLHRTVLVMGGA